MNRLTRRLTLPAVLIATTALPAVALATTATKRWPGPRGITATAANDFAAQATYGAAPVGVDIAYSGYPALKVTPSTPPSPLNGLADVKRTLRESNCGNPPASVTVALNAARKASVAVALHTGCEWWLFMPSAKTAASYSKTVRAAMNKWPSSDAMVQTYGWHTIYVQFGGANDQTSISQAFALAATELTSEYGKGAVNRALGTETP